MLYACKSPVAIDTSTLPPELKNICTYYSSIPVISSDSASTYLGVSVNLSAPIITIGFVSNNIGTSVIGNTIDSTDTNTISGTYPNIIFQNDDISGTITFFDTNQLKITFQQNNSPYFKMRDVICIY